MISVLIADDQDLVREGLRMLLEAEREPGADGEPAAGSRPRGQLAAEHRRTLAHPGQPVPAASRPA